MCVFMAGVGFEAIYIFPLNLSLFMGLCHWAGYDFHKDFVFHSSSPPPLGEAGWLDGAGVGGMSFCHSSGARL